jgi:hypothetical protein
MDFIQDLPPKTTKTTGRPPIEITDEKRKIVAELAKLGLPHDQIAFALRITAKTLRKHFRSELYDSAIEANKEVLTKLYDLAVAGNPAAATFWARTRCKFRAGGSCLDEEETSPSPEPAAPSSPGIIEIVNNDGAPHADW